jgi:hypothetical protein
LEEIMERFGARARRGDDLLEQSLSLMQIAREMIAEDAVELWPRRLRGVPLPKEAMVRRSLDTLCPDGHSLCLGLFKEGELWTALAARRRGKGFDVIAGPDELRPGIGLLSGEWPRDYRHIARAVEEKYAPLAFGCFAEVDTFRSLQTNPNPGAWSRAVAMRDIILSPTPLAVGVALSFDTMRFALDNFRSMTGVDPFGFAEPMYRVVRSRIGQAAGDKDVSTALGFDPLAVLRALLSR